MASNYPPDVTGSEYRIAGPGYEQQLDQRCPNCGDENCLFEQGYQDRRWARCSQCEWRWDYESFEDDLPSYDDLHDADEEANDG